MSVHRAAGRPSPPSSVHAVWLVALLCASLTACLGGQTGSLDDGVSTGEPTHPGSRPTDFDAFPCSIKRVPLSDTNGIGFDRDDLAYALGEHTLTIPRTDGGVGESVALEIFEGEGDYRIDGTCVLALEFGVEVDRDSTGRDEAFLIAQSPNEVLLYLEVAAETWRVRLRPDGTSQVTLLP